MFSTQLLALNYLLYSHPLTQHHSFFRNLLIFLGWSRYIYFYSLDVQFLTLILNISNSESEVPSTA